MYGKMNSMIKLQQKQKTNEKSSRSTSTYKAYGIVNKLNILCNHVYLS